MIRDAGECQAASAREGARGGSRTDTPVGQVEGASRGFVIGVSVQGSGGGG